MSCHHGLLFEACYECRFYAALQRAETAERERDEARAGLLSLRVELWDGVRAHGLSAPPKGRDGERLIHAYCGGVATLRNQIDAERTAHAETRARLEAAERDLAKYKEAIGDKLHFDMKAMLSDTPENVMRRERDALMVRLAEVEAGAAVMRAAIENEVLGDGHAEDWPECVHAIMGFSGKALLDAAREAVTALEEFTVACGRCDGVNGCDDCATTRSSLAALRAALGEVK